MIALNYGLTTFMIVSVVLLTTGCATQPRPKLNEKIDKIAFYNGITDNYSNSKGLHINVELPNRAVETYMAECEKMGTVSTTVEIQPGSIRQPLPNYNSLVLNSGSPEIQDIRISLANETYAKNANTIVLRQIYPADKGLSVVLAANGDALSCKEHRLGSQGDLFVRDN